MSNQWRLEAACRDLSPADADAIFFPPDWANEPDYTEALSLCDRCPVREECLAAALAAERGSARGSRFGMFGGLTPRQRWARDRAGALLDGEQRCVWCDGPFTPERKGQIACSRNCGSAQQKKRGRERIAEQRRERGAA